MPLYQNPRRDGSGTGPSSSIDRRTHYIGNVEILRDGQGHLIEKRRYIAGVALMIIQAHGSTDTRYQHRDHSGSIIALSNEFGDIVARMSFDAWGQRRDPHWNEPPWVQWTQMATPAWAVSMLGHTSRGYTGHTHLDEHGIIHMNGRIYDPHLARFLQADPFVEDTATLNRYSYVHNNPLVYTDPSGYLSLRDIIKIVVVAVITVYTGGLISGAWGFTAGSALSGGAALAAAGMGGALSGYVMPGSLEGALWGAFSAMAFYNIGRTMGGGLGAGEGVAGSSYSATDLAKASVAHGMAGGTISKLQGGRFGHGALSAGINKLVSPAIQNMGGNSYYQGTVSALVGGSVSSISGGKFANGAVTAAMAYAFNSMSERAERRAAGRNLLLGEDESPHILTRKVVRHRLGLLKEAIDGLITDLSLMDARTFADYVGGSYSEAFEHVIEGARDQLLVDLRRVSIGLGARRINQRLDALGTAAIEYGLTKGFGRAVRAMGGSRIASELTPIEPQLPVSRSTLQRRPSVGCTDSAFDTCSVGWR